MVMESSSRMSPVSFIEKLVRERHLWRGQRECLFYVITNPNDPLYNFDLPTGYGKTRLILLVYVLLRMLTHVTRMLIVVPSTTQLDQYMADFLEEAVKVGVDISSIKQVDGDPRTLRVHWNNQAEIFVTTVQQIQAAPSRLRDLMSTGQWLLTIDEHHHYASEGSWSNLVLELPKVHTLAVSATPTRTDKSWSIFGVPHVRVSIQEAYNEEAIRGVRGHIEHYILDVSVDNAASTVRLTTEELLEERPEDFPAYEAKSQLRYHTKYLANILTSALSCHQAKLLSHPKAHQMIIFCMTCKHAKHVMDSFESYVGDSLTYDWIGALPEGRPDEENKRVIERFKNNDLDCLIQVDMAGEGFNIKRASTLVFLSILRKSVKALQKIGRGLRRNKEEIPDFHEDICDIFCSPDTQFAQLVKELEAQTFGEFPPPRPDIQDPPLPGTDTTWCPPIYNIPNFIIIDVEHDKSEIVYPLGKGEEGQERTLQRMEPELLKIGLDPKDRHNITLFMKVLDNVFRKPQSIDQQINVAKKQVQRATDILGNNILTIMFGKNPPPKEVKSQIFQKINRQWIVEFKRNHSEMTVDEFWRKHKWLQEINEQYIKNGKVPAWLQL